VINLVKKSGNKKNLAILYSLFLGENEILEKIPQIAESIQYEVVPLLKGISENEKFWKMFKEKYLMFDDLGTNVEVIDNFRAKLPEHLSDLFYNISIFT
jgi:hypothetical protein